MFPFSLSSHKPTPNSCFCWAKSGIITAHGDWESVLLHASHSQRRIYGNSSQWKPLMQYYERAKATDTLQPLAAGNSRVRLLKMLSSYSTCFPAVFAAHSSSSDPPAKRSADLRCTFLISLCAGILWHGQNCCKCLLTTEGLKHVIKEKVQIRA